MNREKEEEVEETWLDKEWEEEEGKEQDGVFPESHTQPGHGCVLGFSGER